MKKVEVRDLALEDIYTEGSGFYESLSALKPTASIGIDKAKVLFWERQYLGIRTIVVTMDDYIIGTGSVFIEPKFLNGGSKVAHIEDIAVQKAYQKTGTGKMIMEELIAIAREANCYKIILNCRESVVSFYEKLGFHKNEKEMRMDL